MTKLAIELKQVGMAIEVVVVRECPDGVCGAVEVIACREIIRVLRGMVRRNGGELKQILK